MTVPDGALLRCAARMRHGSFGDAVNVWYSKTRFTGVQSNEDVFNAVDAWLTIVYQEFDQLISQMQDPLDLKVDVIEFIGGKWTVTQNVGFGSWGATVNTAESTDLLPSGSCVLGKIRTLLGKHWGRKFLGAFTEFSNAVGFVSSTLQTAALAGMGQYLLGHVFNTTEWLDPILLEIQTGITHSVWEVAVNSVWSYQRSRRSGVGS